MGSTDNVCYKLKCFRGSTENLSEFIVLVRIKMMQLFTRTHRTFFFWKIHWASFSENKVDIIAVYRITFNYVTPQILCIDKAYTLYRDSLLIV